MFMNLALVIQVTNPLELEGEDVQEVVVEAG